MPGYSFLSDKFQPATSKGALPLKTYYTFLILSFVALKIALNLISISHFGLQRDELLYVVLGEHLDWGFKEVPPFIALLAKLSTLLFGNSLLATRLISTIFGGLIVWFTGQIVLELGGSKFAISLTCLALIFSPGFAASGYLFEPVVYDQLWWVLTVWLLIRYIKTSSVKYLYLIGFVTGIGLQTKYSIILFSLSIVIGLLANGQAKILWNKHGLRTILFAAMLALPNVFWEFWHHLPFIAQMNELRTTQLEGITPLNFIIQQLTVNGASLLLWLPGLVFLLFRKDLKVFRFLALAYLIVFTLLLALHGKNYYMLGAYPMLFAAGAYGIEKMFESKSAWARNLSLALIVVPNLIIFPLALPVLTRDQTLAFFSFEREHIPCLLFAAKWDDDKIHPVTQNYGVMCGWDEMAEKVANVYYNLSPDQQKHTVIYAANYGEASALHIYGKQYHLPEVVCLNSSFSLWAPNTIKADYIIYVGGTAGYSTKAPALQTENFHRLAEITDPLAVEKGTGIYLVTHPSREFFDDYQRAYSFLKLH